MNLQRLKTILSEDYKKKWASSYVQKASSRNLDDTINLMKKSKDLSDEEYKQKLLKINRRNSRVKKLLPKPE
jgi:hypothetical protein